MHKLLLVPVPGVQCHPQSVLGQVVYDDIGTVFPMGNKGAIYCPSPPLSFVGGGEKIHLQRIKPTEST